MLKAIALCIPLACLALPSGAGSAAENGRGGAAIACLYMVVTADHDDALACNAPFDSEHEANYAAMHSEMEDYIRTNARGDGDQLLAALKRSASHNPGTPREDICEKFQARKKAIEGMTSAGSLEGIREAMKTPGNPLAGGCI